jgi:hypothetical protein
MKTMNDGYYWVHEKNALGHNVAMRLSHQWYVFHPNENEKFINDRDMKERYEILNEIKRLGECSGCYYHNHREELTWQKCLTCNRGTHVKDNYNFEEKSK